MGAVDWAVFTAYLVTIVAVGAYAARGSRTTTGLLLADRSMPWWAVGLSVMATQASAITVIGTTGQGYGDGMRFAQFYLGLPVAMAILAVTLVPLYHRARVFTAYELLGRRFDAKTRLLTSALFLVSRGLALGVVIYAPSVVLSVLLGWSTTSTVLTMTAIAVGYTMIGGVRAVIWTDVVQMLLVLGGLGACLGAMVAALPAGLPLTDALVLADATGRLELLDLSPDPRNRYTVWSGLLGGTFLFLSYFGCDQSQVQRFLTSRSLAHSRRALLFNAALKIPVQLFVLFLGVVLFVVFHFVRPPLLFDAPMADALARADGAALARLETEYGSAWDARERAARTLIAAAQGGAGAAGADRDAGYGEDAAAGDDGNASPADRESVRAAYIRAAAAHDAVRARALTAARAVDERFDDSNHVFPHFVVHGLRVGLVGLLVAVVFAAAMSSADSELNALATSSVIDVYRHHVRRDAGDAHYVVVSRLFTLGWGVLAGAFALHARALGSVIEAVNAIGSYFYGSLLGVFVLATAFPRCNGHGAFCGVLAGMAAVLAASRAELAWLWLNPIGCLAAVATGLAVSAATGGRAGGAATTAA